MEENRIDSYLDDIGRRPLLTDEQERELSERILAGDQRAVAKLAEANLRFVVKIATQYRGQGLSLDELVSEGNLGLMEAAAKFDASRGTRFVNYAVIFIRRQIERALAPSDNAGGHSANVGLHSSNAGMHSANAGAGSSYIPKRPNDQSPKRPGKPAPAVRSIDAPLGYRSNLSLLSVLVNNNSALADERVYSSAVEHAIELALFSLTERESIVINRFFGLDSDHETMTEIAEYMGLKRERVRQIRDHAIRRLRKNYRKSLAKLV